ncbi:MAG: ACT domain-containing protein [Peptostreptococcaceae bacterium]|nr:ACT domain-containing protein [Peptostreptococcaceae bacterium]
MLKTFLVIDSTILPDAFMKVVEVKELLRMQPNKGISDAVREIGISRSTFYKYKDYIFSLSEGMVGNKATLSFLLKDERGILSSILNLLSQSDANVLTINQDIPINKIANVSITIEIAHLNIGIHELIERISALYGVVKCELLALE